MVTIAYENSGKDGGPKLNSQRSELCGNLRQIFEDATEILSEDATATGLLDLRIMSSQIARFYKAIPDEIYHRPKK